MFHKCNMIIFQSLFDVFLDSILDLDTLTGQEREALICSLGGVPFRFMPETHKEAFRSGMKKWLLHHKSLTNFYERG